MTFNFPNGVPKFPAGVKTEIKPLKPSPSGHGPNDQSELAHWISPRDTHPLAALPREDQDLIVQLVLHSGSFKDLAAVYQVSYPTIRIRVDRVIERLRVIVAGRKPDEIGELLAHMVERGEISAAAAETVFKAVVMKHATK
ncbi:MAG: DUF2089 family protein [Phycisphaeraceae bacterium]|nr:DUF2089 family protein [Phycisphaeraceae bacterium]